MSPYVCNVGGIGGSNIGIDNGLASARNAGRKWKSTIVVGSERTNAILLTKITGSGRCCG